MWLVTIKLPKNSRHDPHNKRTRVCPASSIRYELTGDTYNFACTDATGEHHTFPLYQKRVSIYHSSVEDSKLEDTQQVLDYLTETIPDIHVTRVEGPF